MTTIERLTRIENGWIEIQVAVKAVIKSQTRTNGLIASLAETFGHYADAANARTVRLEANLARLEENLDALIRAITTEHSNGKSKR